MDTLAVRPLEGFCALDGCNCLTSSFRKVCVYNGYTVSEEMLLGLGAGAGFIYWHQKGQLPIMGGRGNVRDFHTDLGRRTGIEISEHTTRSQEKAERELVALLQAGQPVVIYGDMVYLTYLGLPEEAHFGEHAVTVCGYAPDTRQVLIADIDSQMTGYKKGGFHALSLKQLARARSSTYKPFPPYNRWFTFDFSRALQPDNGSVTGAIAQCAQAMLHPPIKVAGVPGIATASQRVLQWPALFDESMLRMALRNVYVFIEIGGSGGGNLRYMYSRFLAEAAEICNDARLAEASRAMQQSPITGAPWPSPSSMPTRQHSPPTCCPVFPQVLLPWRKKKTTSGATWRDGINSSKINKTFRRVTEVLQKGVNNYVPD